MTSVTYNISRPLEQIRAQRGQTLRQLHAAITPHLPQLTPSRLSRYALGYAHATWDEVAAIARALAVTPEHLAGLTPRVAIPPLSPQPRNGLPPQVVPPKPDYPVPPSSPPARNGQPIDTYRALLGQELQRASSTLQTPKLPAKAWAAWRSYEQALRRELAALPAY